jgi:glycosidase
MQAIIAFRKTHPELAGGALETIESGNPAGLAFSRAYQDSPRLVIFANFSEQEQMVSARGIEQNNLPGKQRLFGESTLSVKDELILPPLDFAIFG